MRGEVGRRAGTKLLRTLEVIVKTSGFILRWEAIGGF